MYLKSHKKMILCLFGLKFLNKFKTTNLEGLQFTQSFFDLTYFEYLIKGKLNKSMAFKKL